MLEFLENPLKRQFVETERNKCSHGTSRVSGIVSKLAKREHFRVKESSKIWL
jgi:hypothetical protein